MVRTTKISGRICLVFCAWLCALGGCSSIGVQEVSICEESPSAIELIEADLTKTIVKENAIDIPEGKAFGCMAVSDEYIYYEACEVDANTGNYTRSTVYCLDIQTQETEVVIEIYNDGYVFFTNELICVADALYWVYRDVNEVQIQQYSFDTRQISVLETYPPDVSDLLLTGDDCFLTWFTFDDGMTKLFVYNTESKETTSISDRITIDSPYTRAYVYDGITSFLEIRNDDRVLTVYDLEENTTIMEYVLPDDFGLKRLQANEHSVICTDGYGRDASLYSLNTDQHSLDKIDCSHYEVYLFSYRLYDDLVVVNSNLTNEVVVLSEDNNKMIAIPVECRPVLTGVSQGGVYYACDPTANVIVSVQLEELSAYLTRYL